ncbi:MAG TPA: hypothetical protein VN519_06945 [Bryobacteraceae bacterium]|nr:hypothetical protein [Bryobacteraceae bacterium]
MTREELAAKLNGREYGEEMTKEEGAEAKRNGVVVVYGASDDLMEFRGAIYDEAGAYNGRAVLLDCNGILPSWDDAINGGESGAAEYLRRKPLCKVIEAVWTDGVDDPLPPWSYKTDIAHSTFDIMEDGEVYCRGIVFELVDLL